jgi:hypothetical protein
MKRGIGLLKVIGEGIIMFEGESRGNDCSVFWFLMERVIRGVLGPVVDFRLAMRSQQ